MKDIYDYLEAENKNGYLPKEQLARMLKSEGLTNSQAAMVLGLSESTVRAIKTVTNDQTKFKKTHAVLLSNHAVQRTAERYLFDHERKVLGFIISYTEATWPHRITLAAKYTELDQYNIALDNYFKSLENSEVTKNDVIVISLIEVAKNIDSTPLEVLEQIKRRVSDDIAIEDDEDFDDFDQTGGG